MENTTDLIAVLDLKGQRVYNNRAYQELLGSPEPLRGTDSFREIHPDDQAAIRSLFSKRFAQVSGNARSIVWCFPMRQVR